tara:strand:- start:1121 stop:1465 length:345 start_codon:yes stop_codon:yes gene_type:complete
MDYSKVIFTIIIFFINNILIWYQLNSQLLWQWAKGYQGLIFSSILGIPITIAFWYTTKIGYEGFGALWPVRFMGFATSMLTFPVMTYFYLGESVSLKTAVSIVLSIAIILIQLL